MGSSIFDLGSIYVTEHGLAHFHKKVEMRRGSCKVALTSVGVAQSKLYNKTRAEVLRPV